MYFADDLTLISSSVEQIEQQLRLVQIYCRGSGALLNLNKSKLLSLSGDTTVSAAAIQSMQGNEQVVYLGILFGLKVTEATLIEALHQRLYQHFSQWDHRARTYRGRLLIAQAVILSILWHFTLTYTYLQQDFKSGNQFLKVLAYTSG